MSMIDRQPDYAVFLSKKDAQENDNDRERIPDFAVFVNKNGGGENLKEKDPKIADDVEDKNTAYLNQDDEKNEPDEGFNEEAVVGDNEEAVEGGNEENVEGDNQEAVEGDDKEAMEGDNEEAVEGDNEEAVEGDNEEAIEGDYEEAVEEENEINVEEDKVDDEQRDEEHQDKTDIIGKNLLNTYDDGEPQEGGGESHDREDNENKSEKSKDISNLAADYDQITENVDFDQNEKDCPSVCAARDVMVCAKCQHNIYRTFMSTCHLRLFNCKYPNENLELISRQPCMQSAPFLTDLPGAQGRISEPGDQDNVLKFIHCRDKGKLDDPRCSFDR
nr:glutamic acid-rich protein-like [Vanessa tameamea]